MTDAHRNAAQLMVATYGAREAVERARHTYFTLVGTAGVHFWADVFVATREIKRITELKTYQLIIRSVHERGPMQRVTLQELDRRGCWLSEDQKVQAGLACDWPRF